MYLDSLYFRMSSALLSRFDLVFILLDKPDPEHDLRLSEHVMSMHSKGQRSRQIEPSAIIATARRHTKNVCGVCTWVLVEALPFVVIET